MILDFALVMVIALVVTGAVWGLDRMWWAKARLRSAQALEQAGKTEAAARARQEPVIVEYARAFFPVILIVFVFRSFIIEPFRIPSGSMMSTLFDGDFILVNKYTYGVRLPVVNSQVIELGKPKRGDVIVFRYPLDPSTNYIKRVIGLPGDRVVYHNKRLTVNDQPVEYGRRQVYDWTTCRKLQQNLGEFKYEQENEHSERWRERIDGVEHDILVSPGAEVMGHDLTVPAGHYFVMGDNRDHSSDSRVWGFVPDRNLVGRAFLIGFSLDWSKCDTSFLERIAWRRIGDSIR